MNSLWTSSSVSQNVLCFVILFQIFTFLCRLEILANLLFCTQIIIKKLKKRGEKPIGNLLGPTQSATPFALASKGYDTICQTELYRRHLDDTLIFTVTDILIIIIFFFLLLFESSFIAIFMFHLKAFRTDLVR